MEALDLLKKSWNNSNYSSNQLSENDIYKMLHKKSSSVVRWIFYISLLELGFGFILYFIFSLTNINSKSDEMLRKAGLYEANLLVSIAIYIVVGFFIYNFYKMYRKIETDTNTKDLIVSILKTRRVVKRYIAFNLITFAVLLVAFGTYGVVIGYQIEAAKQGDLASIPLSVIFISVGIIVLFSVILTIVLWLIYKLMYGILLKKLNKNYVELKKLEI